MFRLVGYSDYLLFPKKLKSSRRVEFDVGQEDMKGTTETVLSTLSTLMLIDVNSGKYKENGSLAK